MPQFLNVFFGEMSVVGPRPHPINLNKEYETKITMFNKRHRFKPGITGLAQAKGFSGFIYGLNNMGERVKMDVFYFNVFVNNLYYLVRLYYHYFFLIQYIH